MFITMTPAANYENKYTHPLRTSFPPYTLINFFNPHVCSLDSFLELHVTFLTNISPP